MVESCDVFLLLPAQCNQVQRSMPIKSGHAYSFFYYPTVSDAVPVWAWQLTVVIRGQLTFWSKFTPTLTKAVYQLSSRRGCETGYSMPIVRLISIVESCDVFLLLPAQFNQVQRSTPIKSGMSTHSLLAFHV